MVNSVTLCFFLGVIAIRISFAQDCLQPTVSNGNFAGDTTEGGTAAVLCHSGYTGGGSATCSGGVWTVLPGCTARNCGTTTVANGVLLGDTFYGGTAFVNCNAGYEGGGTAICGTVGTWTSVPGCTTVDCGYPSTTGYIYSSVTTTTSGSSANVACASGYEGTATPANVTCLDTGLWESVTGCTIISCPIPTVPTGYTAPSYTTLTYDSTASVSCDTGYTGSPGDIVCQADKMWSTPTGCAVAGSQNAASLARSILATQNSPGIYPLSKVVLLLVMQYIALV